MPNSQVDVLSLVCHIYERRQSRIQQRLLRVREKREADKARENVERDFQFAEAKKTEEKRLRITETKKAEEEKLRKEADDIKSALLNKMRDEQQRKMEEIARQRSLAAAKMRLENSQPPVQVSSFPVNIREMKSPSLDQVPSVIQIQVAKLNNNIRIALVRHGNNVRHLLQECIGRGVTTVPATDVLAIRRKTMAYLKSFANDLRQCNASVDSDANLMKLIFEKEKEIAQKVNETKQQYGDIEQSSYRHFASPDTAPTVGKGKEQGKAFASLCPASFTAPATAPLPVGPLRGGNDKSCSGQELYTMGKSSATRFFQGRTPSSFMPSGRRQSPLSSSEANTSLNRRSYAIGNNCSLQTFHDPKDNLAAFLDGQQQFWKQNVPCTPGPGSSVEMGAFSLDLEPKPIKEFSGSTPNYRVVSNIEGHKVTPQVARIWKELEYFNNGQLVQQAQRHVEQQYATHRQSHETTDDSRVNTRDSILAANEEASPHNHAHLNPTAFNFGNQNANHQFHSSIIQEKPPFFHPQEVLRPDEDRRPTRLPQYVQANVQGRISLVPDCTPMMSQTMNQFMFGQQTQHQYYQRPQRSTPSTPTSMPNHQLSTLIQNGRNVQLQQGVQPGCPLNDGFILSEQHLYQQPETSQKMKHHFHAMYQQQ
jgi:hypothetical protein